MRRKLFLSAVSLLAGVFTLLANTASASACFFWMYQPEEPKSLRKE